MKRSDKTTNTPSNLIPQTPYDTLYHTVGEDVPVQLCPGPSVHHAVLGRRSLKLNLGPDVKIK